MLATINPFRSCRLIICWAVLLTGCQHGIRDIDFESKQFAATIDAGQHVDTTSLSDFMDANAIYRFSKAGRGTNHIQIGMKRADRPFTWQLEGDSLRINNRVYAVQKREQGFILQSDSVRIVLEPQP